MFFLLLRSTDMRTISLLKSMANLSFVYHSHLLLHWSWSLGSVSGVCLLESGEVAISVEDWLKTYIGGIENIFERHCNANILQISSNTKSDIGNVPNALS